MPRASKPAGSGDKIMVSSDQKTRAYSVLAYANAPAACRQGFVLTRFSRALTRFKPESMTDKVFNRGRERWRSESLSASFRVLPMLKC